MDIKEIENDIENMEKDESMYLWVKDMMTGFDVIEKLQEKYSKDYKFEKTSPVMYKVTKLWIKQNEYKSQYSFFIV